MDTLNNLSTIWHVAILQRIVASATQQKGEPPPRLAPLVA